MSISAKENIHSFFHFIVPISVISLLYILYNLNYPGLAFNHDAAWYADAMNRFYSGQILYRDIIDMTPPYLYYFLYPEYLLSKTTGISSFLAHDVYVGSMIYISCLVSWLCLDHLSPLRRMAMITVIIFAFTFVPAADFGQREHALAILATPWVILNIEEKDKKNLLYILSVLLMTLGILIKPYFILPVLTVATIMAIEKKSIKPFFAPEYIFMALCYSVYIIFITVFFPEYFSIISKFIIFSYYSFSSETNKILTNTTLACIPIMITYIVFSRNNKNFIKSIAIIISFMAIYVVQKRGWTYEIVQGDIISLISLSILLIKSMHKKSISSFFIIILCIFYSHRNITTGLYTMNTTPGLESYTRLHTHPGDTIFFLTEGVSHQYPMIQHFDLVSTSRGAHQWILPGAYLKTLNQNDPQYDTAIKIDLLQKHQIPNGLTL